MNSVIDLAEVEAGSIETPSNPTNAFLRLSKLFTVRNSLFGVLGVLAAGLIIFNTLGAASAWSDKRAAEQLKDVNQASDELLMTANAFAVERGVANIALGFSAPPSQGLIARIRENRTTGNSGYTSALDKIAALPEFEEKEEHLQALREAHKGVEALRTTLDSSLRAGEDDRAPRIARNYYRALSNLIAETRETRLALEAGLPSTNPQITASRLLKHQLWIMSEYSAQEWATIGQNMAADSPLSSLRLQILSGYEGRVESAWEDVGTLVSINLRSGDLEVLLGAVEESYFSTFAEVRDEVYAAAEIEEPYPFTAEEWIDHATEAAASLAELGVRANELASTIADENISASIGQLTIQLSFLVMAILVCGGAFWFVINRVVRPLVRLSNTMIGLADGDLEAEVRGTDKSDEIGDMARSVGVFRDNAIDKIRLEKAQQEAEEERRIKEEEAEKAEREAEEERNEREAEAERAAREAEEERRKSEAEAERRQREDRRKEMLEFAAEFEESVLQLVDELAKSSAEVQEASEGMSNIADNTSRNSSVVSKASEDASERIQMVASATEELSSSVREISGQMGQSSQAARNAAEQSSQAAQNVQALLKSAEQIGEIVNLIDDIAEKTNLLALNATIEAARAGEAGKGFEVVASEVKTLAAQTGQATAQISKQVAGIQSETNEAVDAIGAIHKTIASIEESATQIAASVEEQDASTQEISRSLGEVSRGTAEVSTNIGAVNEGAVTTGAAATQVLGSAQSMSEKAKVLRHSVEEFLGQIRAA